MVKGSREHFHTRSQTVKLSALVAIAAVIGGSFLIPNPAMAQRWESVRTGEYVMELPSGAVIIDCKSWTWRKIGEPSSQTPIIKHHPAYVVCNK